jgi:hypothetical protein
MYELKKIGEVFTSKFVRTGPSSYRKRIYRNAVLQRLRNAALVYVKALRYSSSNSSLSRIKLFCTLRTKFGFKEDENLIVYVPGFFSQLFHHYFNNNRRKVLVT